MFGLFASKLRALTAEEVTERLAAYCDDQLQALGDPHTGSLRTIFHLVSIELKHNSFGLIRVAAEKTGVEMTGHDDTLELIGRAAAERGSPSAARILAYVNAVNAFREVAEQRHAGIWERVRIGKELMNRSNDSDTPVCERVTPGDTMPDGTVFAGISPDTGKPMYTAPADAPLTLKWKDAMEYGARLDANGHHDWRVPTKAELSVLYENRDKGALKGTFNVTGALTSGWYLSSTKHEYGTWGQDFSNGFQFWIRDGRDLSFRCVRG
jgi:hypothetical protein